MKLFISFILLFLAARVCLSLLQFLLRKKQPRRVARALLIVLKALLAVAFAALVMAGPVALRPLQPILMAAYVVLLSDAAADLAIAVVFAVRKKPRSFKISQIISVICSVLFFVYGFFNMQVVTPKYHTFSSEKLSETHTILFAADIHVGSAQTFSVLKKTVDRMKNQHADCLILGGDIMDDYTTREEMEQAFALFRDFGCPVYFIYGNHDLQGHAEYAIGPQYSKDELEQTLKQNNITLLQDEFVRLAPDVLLFGRTDLSLAEQRMASDEGVNPDRASYLILADHQPAEFAEKNLAFGTDLQLSGHTHAGQLFPLQLLYSLIGGYVNGVYQADNGARLLVSAGACGWRMPLRTDARCHYEVVRLEPAA